MSIYEVPLNSKALTSLLTNNQLIWFVTRRLKSEKRSLKYLKLYDAPRIVYLTHPIHSSRCSLTPNKASQPLSSPRTLHMYPLIHFPTYYSLLWILFSFSLPASIKLPHFLIPHLERWPVLTWLKVSDLNKCSLSFGHPQIYMISLKTFWIPIRIEKNSFINSKSPRQDTLSPHIQYPHPSSK